MCEIFSAGHQLDVLQALLSLRASAPLSSGTVAMGEVSGVKKSKRPSPQEMEEAKVNHASAAARFAELLAKVEAATDNDEIFATMQEMTKVSKRMKKHEKIIKNYEEQEPGPDAGGDGAGIITLSIRTISGGGYIFENIRCPEDASLVTLKHEFADAYLDVDLLVSQTFPPSRPIVHLSDDTKTVKEAGIWNGATVSFIYKAQSAPKPKRNLEKMPLQERQKIDCLPRPVYNAGMNMLIFHCDRFDLGFKTDHLNVVTDARYHDSVGDLFLNGSVGGQSIVCPFSNMVDEESISERRRWARVPGAVCILKGFECLALRYNGLGIKMYRNTVGDLCGTYVMPLVLAADEQQPALFASSTDQPVAASSAAASSSG